MGTMVRAMLSIGQTPTTLQVGLPPGQELAGPPEEAHGETHGNDLCRRPVGG